MGTLLCSIGPPRNTIVSANKVAQKGRSSKKALQPKKIFVDIDMVVAANAIGIFSFLPSPKDHCGLIHVSSI